MLFSPGLGSDLPGLRPGKVVCSVWHTVLVLLAAPARRRAEAGESRHRCWSLPGGELRRWRTEPRVGWRAVSPCQA